MKSENIEHVWYFEKESQLDFNLHVPLTKFSQLNTEGLLVKSGSILEYNTHFLPAKSFYIYKSSPLINRQYWTFIRRSLFSDHPDYLWKLNCE